MQRNDRHGKMLSTCATSGVRATYTTATIIGLSTILILALTIVIMRSIQDDVRVAADAAHYTPAVTYTPPPDSIEVAFLGDSFTSGTGATQKANRWTTLLAKEEGWIELNYGFGGTNYSTQGTLKGGRPYAERLTDLITSQPDIVIVSSAGNTLGQDQLSGIKATFQTLHDELPEARIIATSPYYRAEPMPSVYDEFSDDIRAEVETIGGEYIDIGHPLMGHPNAMDDDGTHPNDSGYRLIADAVGEALH